MPDVVFAGPTLPPQLDAGWRRRLDGFEVRPPARRGDVVAALARRPDTIVVLDGLYYTVPSLTHKEILYALDAGVRVIGAASMGALRAAELERFGMIGVGRIFGWYRDGTIEGDDEVAILHGGADDGYRAVTLALVEVRCAVGKLVAREAASKGAARTFVDELRRMPFVERDRDRVLRICGDTLGGSARRGLARELDASSLKQDDARLALELARRPRTPKRRPPRSPTLFLSADRERHARASSGVPVRRIWHAVQLLHPEAPELVRQLRLRWWLATAAHDAGLEPEDGRRKEIVEELRSRLGNDVVLPDPELLEEARLIAGAERAQAELGGLEGACRRVADGFGWIGGDAVEQLLALVVREPGMLASWWLCRSALFSTARPEALRAAVSISEIYRCFRCWANGARVAEAELIAVAAHLWECEERDVTAQAARRGLFASSGPEPGWRDAVEWIAAAERLPRAINDYPQTREGLRGTPLLPSLLAMSYLV